MVQGVWVLARLGFVLQRNPSEVLSQVVLLPVLVGSLRTLIFYLHEHRVAVPLMLEVAIVSELHEILLKRPTTADTQLYANASLLAVLDSLFIEISLGSTAIMTIAKPLPP